MGRPGEIRVFALSWRERSEDAENQAGRRGEALLAESGAHPLMQALWHPRLMEAIDWIAQEVARNREAGRRPVKSEAFGARSIAGVELYGIADEGNKHAVEVIESTFNRIATALESAMPELRSASDNHAHLRNRYREPAHGAVGRDARQRLNGSLKPPGVVVTFTQRAAARLRLTSSRRGAARDRSQRGLYEAAMNRTAR